MYAWAPRVQSVFESRSGLSVLAFWNLWARLIVGSIGLAGRGRVGRLTPQIDETRSLPIFECSTCKLAVAEYTSSNVEL